MKSLLTVALTSHLLPDVPTVSADAWRAMSPLVESGASADEILAFALQSLRESDRDAVQGRLEQLQKYSDAVDELAEQGVQTIPAFDERFPQRIKDRLGPKTPALLFAGGNLELLNSEGIGVVGSRDLDEGGAAFARRTAQESARNGHAVISGGAKGADLVAMTSAVEAGSSAIGYMSDSLSKGLCSPSMRDALDEGRLCLASPFSPYVGFQVANAMARNKLIYAHAAATVVVSASEGEGGTWAGAVEALKLGLLPVLVRSEEGAPDGNRALIKKGCSELNDPAGLWTALDSFAPIQASLEF